MIANSSQFFSPSVSISNQTTSINSFGDRFGLSSLNFVSFQASLAIVHPHRIWPEDLLSPHKSHLSSIKTLRCIRHYFVERTFLHSCHMKCLILFGHYRLHMAFHASILELSEQPGLSSPPFVSKRYLSATLYALLTEKIPFVVLDHTWESIGYKKLIVMLKMASTSWGRKMLLINLAFHLALSCTIRFATFSPNFGNGLEEITLPDSVEGIHLSSHILILLPSLTHHLVPSFTTGSASNKLLQI